MDPQEMDRFESLTTRLYDASIKGDVQSLHKLLQEDPLILDRCIIKKSSQFMQSPLHVAANLGHLEFTKIILDQKPELAAEVDQSKRWVPLHMASTKGHLAIVNALIAVNPNMCFARDLDGRNPVHLATINGQIEVLEMLLRAKPQAGRERTSDGDTILHLCVKHSQLEALEFVVKIIGDGQLLNSKDSDGNTILHLAVGAKHYETIRFLLNDKRTEKNAINSNGLTAMDIHSQSKKDVQYTEIWFSLRCAKVLKAKKLLKPKKTSRDWLEKQRSALMVVASLIATMAFQAGISPPGGVWQDDGDGHKAGTSIMAQVKEEQQGYKLYDVFLVSNTIGLVSSLTVIILLISGLPCLRLFIGILMITMWIAITATTVTYLISVFFLVTDKDVEISSKHLYVQNTLSVASIGWMFLLGILVLVHVLRLIVKVIKQLIRLTMERIRRFRLNLRARNHQPV